MLSPFNCLQSHSGLSSIVSLCQLTTNYRPVLSTMHLRLPLNSMSFNVWKTWVGSLRTYNTVRSPVTDLRSLPSKIPSVSNRRMPRCVKFEFNHNNLLIQLYQDCHQT